jgi:hypothetical protein
MRKFTTYCIAGLFFIGVFAEYGPKKITVYKPVVSEKQEEEGYREARVMELKKDSGRYMKGISYAIGDTQLLCAVRSTVMDNIVAVNLSFRNASEKEAFSMPARPVTSVIDSDSNTCKEISAEEMYNLVMADIEAYEKASSEPVEGEGLFDKSLRKSAVKRRKEQAEQIEPDSYKPVRIPPTESAGGDIYYQAESPRSIEVHVDFERKELVFSFKE